MVIKNSLDTNCSSIAVPITNVNLSLFSNYTNTTTDVHLNNKTFTIP